MWGIALGPLTGRLLAHRIATGRTPSELVPFDPGLAQTMSDRAVDVVRASAAEELLPRVAHERTSVFCRGGRSGGDWHGACAWQDRCWETAA